MHLGQSQITKTNVHSSRTKIYISGPIVEVVDSRIKY